MDTGTRSDGGIRITGAREHNLKDVSLTVPRNSITVFTGVSGSGKSSVVFDTIAVESQRQLNETFTWFVRNRLPKYERPRADSMAGLSPAVVVDQRRIGGNARSTVGTMTDIHSVLRVLFSRCGTPSAGESTVYSFNDPLGMCPGCDGLGKAVTLDLEALLDTSRTLNEGAIRFPLWSKGTWVWQLYAESGLFDPDRPLRDFGDEEWRLLVHGKGLTVPREGRHGTYRNTYEGLAERFTRLYLKRDVSSLSDRNREAVQRFVTEGVCPECEGARLNAAALATRVGGRSIADMAALEAGDLLEVLRGVDDSVGRPIAEAAATALERVAAVGLGYLSLDRETSTLSGGEAQRLKTVRHLGSSLTGMTYVFDEPSIGLHPHDVHRLGALLRQLRDQGNTVLIVEHDKDVIAMTDHVVDLGPGAGAHGGEVVFQGTVAGLAAADTVTGRCLRHEAPVREDVRQPSGSVRVDGARRHNLRDVTVDFPAGVLTVVTGVAGSGKSTLVGELVRAYEGRADGSRAGTGGERGADGSRAGGGDGAGPREAIVADQSGIAASPRSNPATYLGVMDTIRRIFAAETGTEAALFSFNSRGACEECRGRGVIHTDLAYMDPVTTRCQSCGGRRFTAEVLARTVRGKSIADVLDLTAEEAVAFFAAEADSGDVRALRRKLGALAETGLDYLALGQELSSLSGGELQRLKLATRLHRTGGLYVLDEPTTGLHMADVDGLTALLHRLVDSGNSVVVIEHNLDVIKQADRIIDLGPDGGKQGGRVVFEGTPRQLLEAEGSLTAEALRRACA